MLNNKPVEYKKDFTYNECIILLEIFNYNRKQNEKYLTISKLAKLLEYDIHSTAFWNVKKYLEEIQIITIKEYLSNLKIIQIDNKQLKLLILNQNKLVKFFEFYEDEECKIY